MTNGEKILAIRKALGLSRTKFGEKIGVSESVIINIETKGVELKPLMADLICRIYNVNPVYMETGEGEIFLTSDGCLLNEVKKVYDLTDDQLTFIKNFLQLDKIGKENVINVAKILSRGFDN